MCHRLAEAWLKVGSLIIPTIQEASTVTLRPKPPMWIVDRLRIIKTAAPRSLRHNRRPSERDVFRPRCPRSIKKRLWQKGNPIFFQRMQRLHTLKECVRGAVDVATARALTSQDT